MLYLYKVRYLFLKILLLVMGFAYTSSVFELDKDECKENFAKEQCSKVWCAKINDTQVSFQIILSQPALLISANYYFLPAAAIIDAENFFLLQFIPPDKIFIRHRALLI